VAWVDSKEGISKKQANAAEPDPGRKIRQFHRVLLVCESDAAQHCRNKKERCFLDWQVAIRLHRKNDNHRS
jgi:hypothetical protein